MKIRIYLAGWSEETAYRREVHKKYEKDFDIIDPMQYVGCPHQQIVSIDKCQIIASDVLVAYIIQPSYGTVMEVCFAYDHNKIVYIIDPSKRVRKDIWPSSHCHKFFETIDECFSSLKKFRWKTLHME